MEAGATQKGGKVTAQNALILKLDADLENIAVTAEAIAQDAPGFDDLFARPKHFNPHEVLATAEAYLVQLAPQPDDDAATAAAKTARVKQFTDHALPATFVADLQAQVDAIGEVKDTHEVGREQGVKSTAAISHLVRDGRKQVNYLNAIAQNLYKDNPEQLRAWASASHVEHDPSHRGRRPRPRQRRRQRPRNNPQTENFDTSPLIPLPVRGGEGTLFCGNPCNVRI